MAKFHLEKQTRLYVGEPYSGPSCEVIAHLSEFAGAAESVSIEGAIEMKKLLSKHNPVGWNIWDSETQKLVAGINFFEDVSDTIDNEVKYGTVQSKS